MRETLSFVSPTVPEPSEGNMLTVQELAAFLSVGDQTIRKWCATAQLPHGKIGGVFRFDRAQVQAWLDERWHEGSPRK